MIDLREVSPSEKTIDLNAGSSQLGEQALRYKAEKMDQAMGDKSPGADVIAQQLSNTTEDAYRQMISDQHAMDDMQEKTKAARQLLQSREMTTEDLQKLYQGTAPEMLPKETVVETLNTRKNLQELNLPTADEQLNRAVSEQGTRDAVAQNMLKDFQDRYDKQGLGSRIAQRTAQFLPFESWFVTLGNMPVRPSGDKPFLFGEAMQAEIDSLSALSPVDFYSRLKSVAENIYATNPADAIDFLGKVVEYGHGAQLLDNISSIADTGGEAIAVASKLRGIVKAGKLMDVPKSVVLDTAGEIEKGAKQRVLEQIQRKPTNRDIGNLFSKTKEGELRLFRDTLPPLMNPNVIGTDTGSFARADLIIDKLKATGDGFDALFGTAKVTRGTVSADDYGIARAEETLRREFQPYERGILGFNKVYPEESALNAGYAEVKLGKAPKDRVGQFRADIRDATEVPDATPAVKFKGFTGVGVSHAEALDDTFAQIRKARGSEAEAAARKEFDNLKNPEKQLGYVEIKIGSTEALPFKSEKQAHYWAKEEYKLIPGQYKVENDAGGWTIKVRKDVDETDPRYRKLLIETRNQTPEAGVTGFFRRLAGDKLKVSTEQQEARATAVHANQKVEKDIVEMFKPFMALDKNELKDLDDVLEFNKTALGPDGEEGTWFQTLGEYENGFRSLKGRQPTEAEALAYFSYRKINDLLYVMRSQRQFAEQSRYGVELFRVKTEVANSDGVLEPTEFDLKGKRIYSIPEDGLQGGLYVMRENEAPYIADKLKLDVKVHDRIKELMEKENYQLIQLANTDDTLTRTFLQTDEPIAFVLVKAPTRKPLPIDLLPYRAGPEKNYIYPHWTKQVRVRRLKDGRVVYEGDTTIYNHENEAKARKFTKNLEEARQYLLNNDENGFNKFVSENLPDDPRALKIKFFGTPDGKIKPVFDIDVPFSYLRSGTKTVNTPAPFINGQKIADVFGDKFVNPQESPYNIMNMVDKAHTGGRDPDVFAVAEKWGTQGNPIYNIDKAKQMKPMKSLQTSMAKAIRSQHFDDYKIKAIESFIGEFGDLLTKSDDAPFSTNQLYDDPVRTLQNAKLNYRGKDVQTVQRGIAAEYSKQAIQNLLSMQTDAGRQVDAMFQKLASKTYEKLGPEWSKFVPSEEAVFIRDPAAYIRAMAYHSKMSFFNPVQMLVNAQSFVNIVALGDSVSAMKMLPAIYASFADDLNPVARQLWGKRLRLAGWSEGAWADAQKRMIEYGADIVGRSHAFRDDVADPKFVRHAAGRFLDASSWFFTKSEQALKKGSWFVAYDEQLRKTGKTWQQLTKRDYDQIVNRAQTLGNNMTRDASATWQKGTWTAFGTQFTNYQFRMMEMFWGKSSVTGITTAQKMKLGLALGLIYGVTSPFSASTGVPFYDIMRQHMIKNGMDPNDPRYQWLFDGGLNIALQGMTGYDLNTTQRYGPNGLTQLSDLLNAENFGEGMVDIMMGAAGQIIIKDSLGVDIGKGEIHGGIGGLVYDMAYVTDVEGGDAAKSQLFLQDLSNILRNVSTLNNAVRIAMAANIQSYVTKNGVQINDTPLGLSVLQAITGLDTQAQSDIFIVNNVLKDHSRDVKAAEVEIRRVMGMYLKSMNSDDRNQAKAYLSLARAYAVAYGLNNFEMNDMITRYMKRSPQDLIDIMKKKYSDPKTAPRGMGDVVGPQSDQIFPNGEAQ